MVMTMAIAMTIVEIVVTGLWRYHHYYYYDRFPLSYYSLASALKMRLNNNKQKDSDYYYVVDSSKGVCCSCIDMVNRTKKEQFVGGG